MLSVGFHHPKLLLITFIEVVRHHEGTFLRSLLVLALLRRQLLHGIGGDLVVVADRRVSYLVGDGIDYRCLLLRQMPRRQLANG